MLIRRKIARGTPGFSGADLANLVNEAASVCGQRRVRLVGMQQFELAKDKIMMGAERRSMVMSETEKRNTAFHEAGHAIVGRLMPEHDPVYKVSIIPRGRALGCDHVPARGRSLQPQPAAYRSAKSRALFGGRVAEEMTLGADGITTGASNDIQRATEVARNMVTKWGLVRDHGSRFMYDEGGEEVFLGRSARHSLLRRCLTRRRGPLTRKCASIIDECYAKAR